MTVQLRPGTGGELRVRPLSKAKVHRAVVLALDAIGEQGCGGNVDVSSNITPRRGYGSSTADVTAAIKAVLKAFGRALPVWHVAELTVAAEGASDATLWPHPVLFAQREGRLVEDFGYSLPPMRVLAFETVAGGDGVDTLAMAPPSYHDDEVREFARLRAALRSALERRDVGDIGAVATASAAMNQRRLPIPAFDELRALAGECRAAGVQVAHSGDVGGLLFAADRSLDAIVRRASSALTAYGLCPWEFVVGGLAWRR